jgi:hypothetical protein
MMMDVDPAGEVVRNEELLAEIAGFPEGFNQPTACGSVGSGWPRGRVGTASSPLLSGDAWLELLLGDEPIVDLHQCFP